MKKFGKVLGGILACAIIIVIAVVPLWLKSFHIPSGPMIPTLLIGDNLFVSKTAYVGSGPQLGDVALFRSEVVPNTNFIRRVVGLPGDRIQMKEGILYINDVPCPIEPAGEFETVNDDGTVLKAPRYMETLPNGVKHPFIKKHPFGEGTMDNTPVYEVPAGHFFMMGDNRDGSNDSRFQEVVAYIPLKNFEGRASFIYFSTGTHIALWEVWKWPFTAHYSRIGEVIH